MWRLTERMVRPGLVMAWRLATSPTRTSPALEKATTEGVVRDPSALGITRGSPASRTLTTELVVPRSIPTALGMMGFLRVRGGSLVLGCRIKVERPIINSEPEISPRGSRGARTSGTGAGPPRGRFSAMAGPRGDAGRPSGTVTFLFTDVEGSTRLWARDPDAMSASLRVHDVVVRRAIEDRGGYVFTTAGDAFCAAFDRASDAVAAADAAQRRPGRG